MKFNLLILLLFSFLFIIPAYGKCKPSKLEICTKMNLLSAKKFSLADVFSEMPYSGCRVVFKEVDSVKKWKARTSECPSVEGTAYVFIKFACNDTGTDYPDIVQIWNKKECETPPLENLSRVKLALKKLKPGASLSEFQKIGFRPTFRNDREKGTSEYHSYPGVTTQVKLDKKCPDNSQNCSFAEAEFTVISYSEPELDFLTKKECEMWKGVSSGPKVVKGRRIPLTCELPK